MSPAESARAGRDLARKWRAGGRALSFPRLRSSGAESNYTPVMNKPEYWKHELFRELYRLRDLIDADGPELVVSRSVSLEKFVIVTAFMMRKLAEAGELTHEVTASSWPVVELPQTSPPPDRAWFRISDDGKTWRQPLEQYYDFGAPGKSQLAFEHICNRLIHHFAFELRHDPSDDNIDILFNSDRSIKWLFILSLHDYTRLVDEVAADEVRWVDMDRAARRVIKRRYRPGAGETLAVGGRTRPVSWRYPSTRKRPSARRPACAQPGALTPGQCSLHRSAPPRSRTAPRPSLVLACRPLARRRGAGGAPCPGCQCESRPLWSPHRWPCLS
jgi:hypothetical protein